MPTTIIADSSTLIAFLKIHRLDLLESLFSEVVIPPAVAVEVPTLPNTSWIRIHTAPFPIESLPVALGAGEREAISLAVYLQDTEIILDDAATRRAAAGLHLMVIGAAGILVRAKERQLISSVRSLLDELVDTGLYLDKAIIRSVLDLAGE